jgi:hypothetical protein
MITARAAAGPRVSQKVTVPFTLRRPNGRNSKSFLFAVIIPFISG